MKFAYADPPYFGCGASHYGEHHPDAAAWDDKATHLALVARLVDEYPDGWGAWEPVIFRGGRKDPKRSPMVRDWLACAVTRQRGLKGAKPDEFNQWVLDLLAYRDGDTLDDLFPGTGGMADTLTRRTFDFDEAAS